MAQITHNTPPPMVTTYSMWQLFKNCRMACKWRYFEGLVPLSHDPNLSFGSVIHTCLELWHRERNLANVLRYIDETYPTRGADTEAHSVWHLARAMMSAYARRYPVEEFTTEALEKTFEGPIVNPATGVSSRSFTLAGKVDGIVTQYGKHFLLEHKTTSQIDGGYLERLWTDFQIILYSWYLEQTLGITITGVIYNILVKVKLRQKAGETEAEAETRRRELAAKSVTGKSAAKRKMPEDDDAFQDRLQSKYLEPGMLHREVLYISRDQFKEMQAELWDLSKALLDARRHGGWYRNTNFCFHYGRPCAYFPLCRANGSSNVIDNYYQRVAPHEELQLGINKDVAPVF